MRSTYRYRSFFWPALLILVGVIALLANTGQIPADRLLNLVYLWPLILIVLGLELIVRRSLHGVAGDMVAALIIIVAILGATAYVVAEPKAAATHSFDSSADLGTIAAASLQIDAGSAQITVSSVDDIGTNLYKSHIEYSGPEPKVTLDRSTGALRISQQSSFFNYPGQRFVLDLHLNASVPWKIEQNTGAATDTYLLGNAHIRGVSLNTGASQDELTLGTPSGITPVSVDGGSLTVRIHRLQGTPASIDVNGGAVSLDADGQSYHGIGHVGVTTDLGEAGYRIEINGGACNISLDSVGSE